MAYCLLKQPLERHNTSVGNVSVLPHTSMNMRELLVELNPTSTLFVKNILPSIQVSKYIREFILERNLQMYGMWQTFHQLLITKNESEFVLGTNHTNAWNVRNPLPVAHILKVIRVFTLGRKLTNLRNVTNPLLNTHVLEAIRVFTLERNFTNIRNVTTI